MTNSTLSKATYAQQLHSKSEVGKKPYSPPQLIEYGDLVEITAGGLGSKSDAPGSTTRSKP